LKDFDRPVPQGLLNIEDKSRSNLFAWRGQFSPQLIECLLDAYCLPGSVVLDPFAGSGTVLYEAAARSLPAFGYEINPSAWSFSKIYEFANVAHTEREMVISELRAEVERGFPIILFSDDGVPAERVEERVVQIGRCISDEAKVLCTALVVLLDVFNNPITNAFVQGKLAALAELVRGLPYSPNQVKADLRDARCLPLGDQSVDFALTSPPYINVFNYHQNYRRSVELLGWDLLRVARSEIGANRANRANRFQTVVQYCIDMANAMGEMARVLRPGARAVLVVGYESRVLGAPFHNADIVQSIASRCGAFGLRLRQERRFTNRFGEAIREDILNLERLQARTGLEAPTDVGRTVAREALAGAATVVPERNRRLLLDAVGKVDSTAGTPVLNSHRYSDYQTRQGVMMVSEGGDRP
jgi:SAM-dependent methyltransferase